MRNIKMPAAGTVTPGATSSFQLPLGPTYNRFDLYMTAGDPAVPVTMANWGTYIDDIRILVNGDTTWVCDASNLVKLNSWHGSKYMDDLPDGVLPIYLTSPWARTIGGEESGSYGTAQGVVSMTLEVDLKAGQSVGTLDLYAERADLKAWGAHKRLMRYSRSFGSAAREEVSDLKKGAYNLLGLHVTDANIGDVEVQANGITIHDTRKAIREARDIIAGRTPQGSMTHIDMVHERQVNAAQPMALSDFRVKLNFDAAPNAYQIYAEGLFGPNG